MPIDVLNALEVAAVVLGALFVGFLPFELWLRWRQGELTWSSVREMGASVSPLIPTLLLSAVVIGFISILFYAMSFSALWQIETTWLSAVICIVLVDFLYYLDHYCGHRFRVYWAISHSVHHSSPQFDQTTGLRVSAVDGFTSPWFLLPAVMLGFDIGLIFAAYGIVLAYQQWIHTETVPKLGWFDKVFNSPSNHRVHHGSDKAYLDRNYGGIFVVWDQLFGTYAEETHRPTYGLVKPIESANPIAVHLHEARYLWRDVRAAETWAEVWHHLFARPGAPFLRKSGVPGE